MWTRGSVEGTVTRQRAGGPEFEFRQVKEIFIFSKTPRPIVKPTKLPIQWVSEALSPGGGGHESDNSSSFSLSAEVNPLAPEFYI